ncbi:hypothetical protein H8S90_22125 [Olivibacter sp. SDN3]|uniref:hypothetical protein n=1 Tax=Olivibacter sp. SDN3 TaxID=2764720 RepID=UPI0016517187|nr:hypothetical protein [Olivibacter sp. SDN3]QNL49394.1 hypothetical protein H8S90_22125 [Olivibacter sp. SDN3]
MHTGEKYYFYSSRNILKEKAERNMLKSLLYLTIFVLAMSCQNNTTEHASSTDDSIRRATYIQDKKDSIKRIRKYILDSIGVSYKEAGFKNYCDALLQDEYLYLAATCIAEEEEQFDEYARMDLESSTYQKFRSQWLKENDLDSSKFERDRETELADLESFCRKQIVLHLNDLKPKIIQLIKTNGTDLDYNFLINYFKNNTKTTTPISKGET